MTTIGRRRIRPRHALSFGVAVVPVVVGVVLMADRAFASHGSPTIDLTTAAASVTHNGAIITQGGGPAGTGNFDPFLTLQNTPSEAGHNSTSTNDDTDAFYGGDRTHPLRASAVPVVTVSGVKYREFALDSNDTGSDPYVSVDRIRIFIDDQQDLKQYNDTTRTFGNDNNLPAASKIWDLDDGGDTTILMSSQELQPGSGEQDVTLLVPDSLFPSECFYGSTTCQKFVVFHSALGLTGTSLSDGRDYDTSAGFEEWRTRKLPVVNVSKTAVPSFDRTYDWTVKKEVSVDGGQTWLDEATLDAFNGDEKSFKWRVSYDRDDGTDSNQKVTGVITVLNPTGNGFAISEAIDATVTSVTDQVTGLGSATINGCTKNGNAVTLPHTLKGGESLVCTYTKTLASTPTGDRVNVATATVGTTSYTGNATFNFASASPTQIDASAVVADPPRTDVTVSGDGSFNYDDKARCGVSRDITNTATLTEGNSQQSRTDSAVLHVVCHGLTVTKTADPSFTRTFDWTVKKYVSLDGTTFDDASVTLKQFDGDTSDLSWKIVVDRDNGTDGSYAVKGVITVANASPIDATGVSVSDAIAGVGAATVDCDAVATGNQTTLSVPAGTSRTCQYSSGLPDGTTRLNTAKATLFANDYSGTKNVDFTGVKPKEVDASATLDDNLASDPPLPKTVADGEIVSYTTRAGCGADRTIQNTATLTEGDSSQSRTDSAQAVVDCLQLTVSKTATPTFTRTWTWKVMKAATAPTGGFPLLLNPGETFLQKYDVTYSATAQDSAWAVGGVITVSSPPGAPENRTVTVADAYTGGGTAVVSGCKVGATPVTLPHNDLDPGETLTCEYKISLSSAANGSNTGKATLTNTPSGSTEFASNPVSVTFGAPTTKVHETINVADNVPAGELCTGSGVPVPGCTAGSAPSGSITVAQAPKTFTYYRIIGPYTAAQCGAQEVVNTASFAAADDAAHTGQATVTVPIRVACPQGCTLTQGYWKTHNVTFKGGAPVDANWERVPSLTFGSPLLYTHDGLPVGSREGTVFFKSGQTWFEVFWTSPRGNPYYNLAHQYMAAVLNGLDGADTSVIDAQLDRARVILGTFTPAQIDRLRSTDALRSEIIGLAGVFGSYNEGSLGIAHCSEDATAPRS